MADTPTIIAIRFVAAQENAPQNAVQLKGPGKPSGKPSASVASCATFKYMTVMEQSCSVCFILLKRHMYTRCHVNSDSY